MRKLIAQEWITIDGVFDSDPRYFEQWFMPYHSEARGRHIQETILGCGAMLMGATTYRALAPYWSSLQNNEMGVADKMNDAPKYVVSTTLASAEWSNTRKIIGERVTEEVAALKEEEGEYILVPGSGTLVHSLIDAGLVDELRFLVHPVIMSGGRRFFRDGMSTTKLSLSRTEALDGGVLALTYVKEH